MSHRHLGLRMPERDSFSSPKNLFSSAHLPPVLSLFPRSTQTQAGSLVLSWTSLFTLSNPYPHIQYSSVIPVSSPELLFSGPYHLYLIWASVLAYFLTDFLDSSCAPLEPILHKPAQSHLPKTALISPSSWNSRPADHLSPFLSA